MSSNLIIIDGSYFVFFRYYAVISWWKIAKKEPPLPEDPYQSQDFIDCSGGNLIRFRIININVSDFISPAIKYLCLSKCGN